eukprot:TRINITY_DN82536_c0_g1_i1.p1 TRINITY_DN82536_c0_g1~~TRINITY_DN82536_c0_g1_i1.p1  ORF type:complete len:367 (+),score=90.69 TRINITY_DN82536_c0_g1_i1:31-1131(+)
MAEMRASEDVDIVAQLLQKLQGLMTENSQLRQEAQQQQQNVNLLYHHNIQSERTIKQLKEDNERLQQEIELMQERLRNPGSPRSNTPPAAGNSPGNRYTALMQDRVVVKESEKLRQQLAKEKRSSQNKSIQLSQLKYRVEQLQEELAEARIQVTALSNDDKEGLSSVHYRLQRAETEHQASKKKIADLQVELADKAKRVDELERGLHRQQALLQHARSETERLSEQLRKQTDAMQHALLPLGDLLPPLGAAEGITLAQLNEENEILTAQLRQCTGELLRYKELARAHGMFDSPKQANNSSPTVPNVILPSSPVLNNSPTSSSPSPPPDAGTLDDDVKVHLVQGRVFIRTHGRNLAISDYLKTAPSS